MPQIAINLSVFTEPHVAFGRITGLLDLAAIPREGERISFQFPHNDIQPKEIEGFYYRVTVRSVTHLPGSGQQDALLELDDLELRTIEDAAWVMAYLDKGFGLENHVFER